MNSLDELFFLPEEERRAGDGTIVLATVYAVDEDEGLTLIFDGDSSASQKKYKMLMNGKTPAAGDRVAAVKHSGTYIVLGVIGTNGGSTPATASPNTVFAGPASGETAGEATFRQLVAADLPGDGFVLKAGDTMTGELDIKSPSLHQGNPPSTSEEGIGTGIKFVDADGNVMADLIPQLWTDGSQSICLRALTQVSGSPANNWITITKRKDGTSQISFGAPIPLDMGGTGMSSVKDVDTAIFVTETGFSLYAAHLRIWGRMADLQLYLKKDTADPTTDMVRVGTIYDTYRPYTGVAGLVTNDGRCGYIYKGSRYYPCYVYVKGPFTTDYFYVLASYMIA